MIVIASSFLNSVVLVCVLPSARDPTHQSAVVSWRLEVGGRCRGKCEVGRGLERSCAWWSCGGVLFGEVFRAKTCLNEKGQKVVLWCGGGSARVDCSSSLLIIMHIQPCSCGPCIKASAIYRYIGISRRHHITRYRRSWSFFPHQLLRAHTEERQQQQARPLTADVTDG